MRKIILPDKYFLVEFDWDYVFPRSQVKFTNVFINSDNMSLVNIIKYHKLLLTGRVNFYTVNNDGYMGIFYHTSLCLCWNYKKYNKYNENHYRNLD